MGPTANVEVVSYLALDEIRPNPHQPRQDFDEGALDRLAESIRQDGVMQPIVVRRRLDGGGYELVAGERRWRAAQRTALPAIPAIVRDLTDQQLAEWALVENLQREDLNPIERAEAFASLIHRFGLSHESVAERVGVERPTVSNYLRILDLHDDIQQSVRVGTLSMGHARALLGLSDTEAQLAVARKVMAGGWSVRQTERAIRELSDPSKPVAGKGADGKAKPAHLADLEKQIANQLQTKVRLKTGRRKGTGTLSIDFFSIDQFDELLEKLGVKVE